MYPNISINVQTNENFDSFGDRSCRWTIKETIKTPLHNFVCFQMPKRTPGLKFWSVLIFEWEATSFYGLLLLLLLLPTSKWSRFSQGFTLSTTLHCSLPSNLLCFKSYFEYLPVVSSAFNIFYTAISAIVYKSLLLKKLDTIGNCQRPILSLGVSQHNYACTK